MADGFKATHTFYVLTAFFSRFISFLELLEMNTDCLSHCFSDVVKIRPGPPSCTWLSVHFEQALCQPTRTWVEQEEIKMPSSSNNSPWRHLIQGSPWVLLVSRSQGPLCGRSSAWPQGHLEYLRFTSANNQEY